MQEKYEQQQRLKKMRELGMPLFFWYLAESVEMIRDSHPDVESYGFQKVLKILKIRNKVEKRKALTGHILVKDFFSMVHGGEKKAKENMGRYNKTLKEYQK